jgi:hypothetical protein
MKIKRQSPQRLPRVSGFKSSNLSVLARQSSLGGVISGRGLIADISVVRLAGAGLGLLPRRAGNPGAVDEHVYRDILELRCGVASLDRVAQDGVRVRASAGAASSGIRPWKIAEKKRRKRYAVRIELDKARARKPKVTES